MAVSLRRLFGPPAAARPQPRWLCGCPRAVSVLAPIGDVLSLGKDSQVLGRFDLLQALQQPVAAILRQYDDGREEVGIEGIGFGVTLRRLRQVCEFDGALVLPAAGLSLPASGISQTSMRLTALFRASASRSVAASSSAVSRRMWARKKPRIAVAGPELPAFAHDRATGSLLG